MLLLCSWEPRTPPARHLRYHPKARYMLSEKSHVGCDLLIQHSCCKDPFSIIIPPHLRCASIQPKMPPETLLSDSKCTLHMPSEKSHVGCNLLIQHSCCKDPFSMVIPPHLRCASIQPGMPLGNPTERLQMHSPCRQRNLMWVVISSYSIPAARIRFRWSSRRMWKRRALNHLQLLPWCASIQALLSDSKCTLHMPSEKSHVGCDLLIQHSCCKDPFSIIIPPHLRCASIQPGMRRKPY